MRDALLQLEPHAPASTRVTQKSPGARITGWATDPDTTDADQGRHLRRRQEAAAPSPPSGTGKYHSGPPVQRRPAAARRHAHRLRGRLNTLYGSGNSPHSAASRCTLALRAARQVRVDRPRVRLDRHRRDRLGDRPGHERRHGPDQGHRRRRHARPPARPTSRRPDVAHAHPGTRHASTASRVTRPADDGEHTRVRHRGERPRRLRHARTSAARSSTPCTRCAPSAPTQRDRHRRLRRRPRRVDARRPPTAARRGRGYTITAQPGGPSMTVGPTSTSATAARPQAEHPVHLLGGREQRRRARHRPACPPRRPPRRNRRRRRRRRRSRPAATSATSPAPRAPTCSDDARGGRRRRDGQPVRARLPDPARSRRAGRVAARRHAERGTRFVCYADMVKNLNAYVDGYASQQRPSAPVTIAIGTNNDIDVSTQQRRELRQPGHRPGASLRLAATRA